MKREDLEFWTSKGFKIFPVARKSKIPTVKWSTASTSDLDSAARMFAMHSNSNIGVALGARDKGESHVVVVDMDGEVGYAELERLGLELPRTFMSASGKEQPGMRYRHYFYRWPDGEPFRNLIGLYDNVDVKGQGGYVVGAPSLHASGNKYRILTPYEELADAPEWLVSVMREYLAPRQQSVRIERDERVSDDDVLEFAREFCRERAEPSIQGAGGSRDLFSTAVYVVKGLEIPTSTAASILLDEYNDRCQPPWSAQEIERACERAHEAAKPYGYALQYVPSSLPEGYDKIDFNEILASLESERREDEKKEEQRQRAQKEIASTDKEDEVVAKRLRQFAREHAEQMELVRELAMTSDNAASLLAWLDGPQPLLSVAAVLALGAAYVGRRIVTRTNLIPSLYLVGVAASGDGKGAAKNAITSLVKRTWPELFVSATWPSVQAAWESIRRNCNDSDCAIVFHDNEIGKIFSGIFDKRGAESKRAVARMLLDVNPCTCDDVKSAAQSLAAGGGESNITAPHVSIYGTTTPTALQTLLQSEAREDGLIGRIVWFRGIDGTAEPVGHAPRPVPDEVHAFARNARDAFVRWQEQLAPSGADAMKGDAIRLYEAMPAAYEDSAIDALSALAIRWHIARVREDDEVRKSSLNRAQEITEKVAVIIAAIRDMDRPRVSRRDVEVASEIVRRSIATIAPLIERSDNEATETGRAKEKIFSLVYASEQPISKSDMTRALQRFRRQTRDEALADLVEAGDVRAVVVPMPTNKKAATFYAKGRVKNED